MSRKNIISYLALTLSIIACIITWLRIDITITNDTFVGIMAGFMGACATILVGVQIYNSIETSKKIKELENLQRKINSDIEFLKNEREKGEHYTTYSMNISVGVSTLSQNVFFSFNALVIALKEALILNDPEHIRIALGNIESLCKNIDNKNHMIASVFKIEKYNPEELKIYPAYPLIEHRYKQCHEIIIKAYERCLKLSQTAS